MRRPRRLRAPPRIGVAKVAVVAISIAVFVLALELMQAGAGGLAALFREGALVSNPVQGLGLGWLFAYVVLSGSPVAAAALTLLADGAVSPAETFAMIAGSRLGASLVVILLGLAYVVRGGQTRRGLATGALALVVTATVYLPALLLGLVVLDSGLVPPLAVELPGVEGLAGLYRPVVDTVRGGLPDLGVFVVGLATMVVSFGLFDRGLPSPRLEGAFGRREQLVFRPIVMFAAGLVVTALTFSVSISVGLLVPMSARGMIRRENIIPYVMGCNVSTFVDTLFVAVLLQSAEGFTVVLIEMVSVAAVSLVFLAVGFETYQRAVNAVVDRALASRRSVRVSLAVLAVVPVLLLMVR